MKLSYKVDNPKYCRSQSHEIDLPGYYGTQEVIEDFEKVIQFHEMAYKEWKNEYIDKWGQEYFERHILGKS